jgi:hypothetical protein
MACRIALQKQNGKNFLVQGQIIYDEGKPLSIDTMKYIVESIPTPKLCYTWRERVSRLPKQDKGYWYSCCFDQ